MLLRRLISSTLMVAMLSGCKTCPRVLTQNLCLTASSDMNNNTATTIDLVLAKSAHLARALSQITSSQYFSTIDQIRRDNPSVVSVFRWELIPGQVQECQKIMTPDHKKLCGAFVFSDYQTKGAHRINISAIKSSTIALQKTTTQISSTQEPSITKLCYPESPTKLLNTRIAQ